MQALILAAGRSKRFQPLGDKNFFKPGERFLVKEKVEALREAGVKDFLIVGNKDNLAKLRETFPQVKVLQQKNLDEGMKGGVLACKKFLTQPTLIVSTNDVFEASELKKVMSVKNCDGGILIQKVKNYFPGGYVEMRNGVVKKIVEKPHPSKTPSEFVNLVCHFFKSPQTLMKELEKISNHKDDAYEIALQKLFTKRKFLAIENKGGWIALKYPWNVLDLVEAKLKKQKRKIGKNVKIAKSAVVEGNCVIEAGVKILDFAIVKNSRIGKNTIVGNHTLIRDSMVGENCVVGGSEVARSYLGNHSWLHRNYVGDSILDENVSLGSGCVCANLRLDEEEIFCEVEGKKASTQRNKFGCVIGKNSRVGVNTSVMPSVIIGENCFVGSGLVVEKNLKSGSFLNASWKTKTIPNKKVVGIRGKLEK